MENQTPVNETINPTPAAAPQEPTKFCKHCGEKIAIDAVLCTSCGRQVEELKQEAPAAQPQIIINNENTSSNVNTNTNVNNAGANGRERNKWVAVALCFFLGYVGAHRFYEGKTGTAILYIFTAGLFGVGVLVDLIILLMKPNPYYV